MNYYLAIDIGASSGRHIVGWSDGGEIKTDEVYRFENGVLNCNGSLVWDIEKLTENIKHGIDKALSKYPKIKSLAIDTWGVDYVLMNGNNEILPCYAYRDNRTQIAIHRLDDAFPFSELYRKTGIQFQPFNSIYQLIDDKARNRLTNATDFLMIPEYLTYKITGIKAREYTNATTTGLVNAFTHDWDYELIRNLGLPKHLFGKLYMPGTYIGKYKGIDVLFCASHDTASAVEGVPMTDHDLYLSSGTWSLLGARIEQPITTEESRSSNFTNEGGVGYIRYLKNIMGMWVVNELRKELCPNKPFDEIISEAKSSSFTKTVDVNAEAFLAPPSMKSAIDSRANPKTIGDYFNCAFNSLALCYSNTIKEIEKITGKVYDKLYIVGGGAKNTYLNELTEIYSGKKVVALPIEATAIGNIKVQMRV